MIMTAIILITGGIVSVIGYFIWKRFLKAEFDAFVIRDNERIEKKLEFRKSLSPQTPHHHLQPPLIPNSLKETEKEHLPSYKEADLKQSLNDWCNRIVGDKPKGKLTNITGNDYYFEKG